MLYESTTDMQCSDDSSDSGDDEPMMVGSDDQFSDLDTEGTTLLILLFIKGGRLQSVTRRIKDGSKVNVPCPSPVSLYNTFMRGVDRGDQLRGY